MDIGDVKLILLNKRDNLKLGLQLLEMEHDNSITKFRMEIQLETIEEIIEELFL